MTATANDTGTQREAVSDSAGIYQIAALQPGSYMLTVNSPGFKQTSEEVRLEVGQQATLDMQLALGSDSQSITVEASGELLKTQDASVGEVVDQRSVESLPLNGRMLIDLVLTVPGAHISHGAATGDMNALYWRPGQRSAVSIGGSRPNANYFLLDGATNTDPTFNAQNFSASPDAVQEFQVQTGSYSADMGGAGGGQINIVTRSGTAKFHGTAYEFLRNGAMDAHSFNQMGSSNFLVQNNFGAALGGPIPHAGKTFFFLNYEGLRHVRDDVMVDTVPTPGRGTGDFSQSGVDIYDPNSTQPNPAYNPSLPVSKTNPQYIRQQFSYNGVLNVIPPDRLTQAASIMLNKYTPAAQHHGHGQHDDDGPADGYGRGQRRQQLPGLRKERMSNDQGTVRIDHSFANGDSAFFRYSVRANMALCHRACPALASTTTILRSRASWPGINHSRALVNSASLAVSRLAMIAYHRERNTRTISWTNSELPEPALAVTEAMGRALFQCPGILADRRQLSGHADARMGHGRRGTRFAELADRPAQRQVRRRLSVVHLADVGLLPESAATTSSPTVSPPQYALNDGSTGSPPGQLCARTARGTAGAGWAFRRWNLRQWYANGYAQDAWRLTPTTT